MKSFLCWLFAPRYFQDMPVDAPGVYRAEAVRFSHFHRRVVLGKRVEGRLAAYKVARWLALRVDFSTPKYGRWEEVGVRWEITRIG